LAPAVDEEWRSYKGRRGLLPERCEAACKEL
jgi:hypothetical protein